MDSPACRASYSSTICRYIGSAIIVPPRAICWSSCPVIPYLNILDLEQIRVEQGRLPLTPRRPSHQASPASAMAPIPRSAPTDSPPSCHTRMLSTTPPMPRTDRTPTDRVDTTSTGVGDFANQSDAGQHDRDDEDLEEKPDPPRQVGGDEPAEQWPDGGGDRRRRPDQGVHPALGWAFEVAVDEELHGRQQQRRAQPTQHGPEDDDRGQALGECHRQGTDGITEQPQHIGPLAPEEITHLAADQDERGRHQRLQRDRRLDPAGGRVKIPNHRRDRHVHQRGVDHQHEHRRGQQDGKSRRARSLLWVAATRCFGHRRSIILAGVRRAGRVRCSGSCDPCLAAPTASPAAMVTPSSRPTPSELVLTRGSCFISGRSVRGRGARRPRTPRPSIRNRSTGLGGGRVQTPSWASRRPDRIALTKAS